MNVLIDQSVPPQAFSQFLRNLHELIREGQGESAEADALRDQMDALWHGFSEQQQHRFSGLSEDLYSIAEGSCSSVEMSPSDRKAWALELHQAQNQRDWDKVLQLLRRPPIEVPERTIRFFQSQCWEMLGDPETALVFMHAAASAEPLYLIDRQKTNVLTTPL